MIVNSIYALIATLGFGILFNIKGKNLVLAAAGGALTWLIYEFCLSANLGTSSSLFCATAVLTIYSEIMARLRKQPVTLFVIAGIIPLVPGSGMYYTTLELVTGNVNKSLNLGVETLLNAGAIAVGVIMVSTVSRFIKRNR